MHPSHVLMTSTAGIKTNVKRRGEVGMVAGVRREEKQELSCGTCVHDDMPKTMVKHTQGLHFKELQDYMVAVRFTVNQIYIYVHEKIMICTILSLQRGLCVCICRPIWPPFYPISHHSFQTQNLCGNSSCEHAIFPALRDFVLTGGPHYTTKLNFGKIGSTVYATRFCQKTAATKNSSQQSHVISACAQSWYMAMMYSVLAVC